MWQVHKQPCLERQCVDMGHSQKPTMWTFFIILLLYPTLSEACVPTLELDTSKLLIGLDQTIRNHASLSSTRYESPALHKKTYQALINQMWFSVLKAKDLSIEFYDGLMLCLEEHEKVLNSLSKELVYLPLRFGGGKRVIYMADIKKSRIMSLTISAPSLQALKTSIWTFDPFWSTNRPAMINPLSDETGKSMKVLKHDLDWARRWVRMFAQCAKSNKHRLNVLLAECDALQKRLDECKKRQYQIHQQEMRLANFTPSTPLANKHDDAI